MSNSVEIVFSTYGCGIRSIGTFILMALLLTFIVIIAFRRSPPIDPEEKIAPTFPQGVDRLATYSILALVTLAIAAPAFAMALGQSNTSLVANGSQIEVQGCVLARPFRAVFDRAEMSATLRYQRRKNSRVIASLILRQQGQRTVRVGLGEGLVDQKLAEVVPEAMRSYAQQLREDGETVAPYLRQLLDEVMLKRTLPAA
ncbi:hypothetical protein PV773_23235 [Mesorhizobium sp. CC13]|uniref:hypothetical protein n=1 Tax=Mesorhizobium sp. CC13 TaxID=3029194 RepID=UPI0032655714